MAEAAAEAALFAAARRRGETAPPCSSDAEIPTKSRQQTPAPWNLDLGCCGICIFMGKMYRSLSIENAPEDPEA